jgi:hypothetical protein
LATPGGSGPRGQLTVGNATSAGCGGSDGNDPVRPAVVVVTRDDDGPLVGAALRPLPLLQPANATAISATHAANRFVQSAFTQ